MTCIYLGDAGGREGENAAGTFLISELAKKTNSKNNPTNRGPPPLPSFTARRLGAGKHRDGLSPCACGRCPRRPHRRPPILTARGRSSQSTSRPPSPRLRDGWFVCSFVSCDITRSLRGAGKMNLRLVRKTGKKPARPCRRECGLQGAGGGAALTSFSSAAAFCLRRKVCVCVSVCAWVCAHTRV